MEYSIFSTFFIFAEINFAPTYRMLKGKKGYSNKRNQSASYTDRIMWRSRVSHEQSVDVRMYDGELCVFQKK